MARALGGGTVTSVIYQYPLPLRGDRDYYIPVGSEFLQIGVNGRGEPAAYYLVDPDGIHESLHQFESRFTGDSVPEGGEWLGSVTTPTGLAVHVWGWHDARRT